MSDKSGTLSRMQSELRIDQEMHRRDCLKNLALTMAVLFPI
jgi:hypothetical protein